MAWGMENKAAQHTVGIAELRVMVLDRLQSAERRLAPGGAAAAFNRANDNGQDNMLGSLLLGMIGWAPMMEAFGGLNEAFSAASTSPVLAAAADGLSMVWDEKAYKNRRRRGWAAAFKDGIYHGGRRQVGILTAQEMKKNFNLVSVNENAAFAYDAEAEIAGMSEIVDMLDRLEKEGITRVKMSTDETIATQLKTVKAEPAAGQAQHTAAAFRKAI